MAQVDVPLVGSHFGQTSRADSWWVQPLFTFLGLGGFIVYATWGAFHGQYFRFGPYLSPFYSPELFGDPQTSWFGAQPAWIPLWVTGAMLVLWAPGGFRLTCYYYRGAYYKAFWADPPSCTVGEPRKKYLGERSFPLIIQNVHRYFLYLALDIPGAPHPRRVEGFPLRWPLGPRYRFAGINPQCRPARLLYPRLPLVAPYHRGISRPFGGLARPQGSLRLRELP